MSTTEDLLEHFGSTTDVREYSTILWDALAVAGVSANGREILRTLYRHPELSGPLVSDEVELHCKQGEIADLIGVSRKTVGRNFAELERIGAIRPLGNRGKMGRAYRVATASTLFRKLIQDEGIAARLSAIYGSANPIAALFKMPTPAELAAEIEREKRATYRDVLTGNDNEHPSSRLRRGSRGRGRGQSQNSRKWRPKDNTEATADELRRYIWHANQRHALGTQRLHRQYHVPALVQLLNRTGVSANQIRMMADYLTEHWAEVRERTGIKSSILTGVILNQWWDTLLEEVGLSTGSPSGDIQFDNLEPRFDAEIGHTIPWRGKRSGAATTPVAWRKMKQLTREEWDKAVRQGEGPESLGYVEVKRQSDPGMHEL